MFVLLFSWPNNTITCAIGNDVVSSPECECRLEREIDCRADPDVAYEREEALGLGRRIWGCELRGIVGDRGLAIDWSRAGGGKTSSRLEERLHVLDAVIAGLANGGNKIIVCKGCFYDRAAKVTGRTKDLRIKPSLGLNAR